MHKARQDAHVVQEHERQQHSVISFDFGFASRTDGDKLTGLFIHDQFTKLMGAIQHHRRVVSPCITSLCKPTTRKSSYDVIVNLQHWQFWIQ